MSTASDWRDAFTDLHGASRITLGDDGPWRGRLEWQKSRAYGVALCGDVREEFVREPRHIRRDPRDCVELLVPIVGDARVEQGGGAGAIRPGTMALCDVDRPLRFSHAEAFVSVSLIVPGETLRRRHPAVTGDVGVLDGTAGLGRLIRQTLVAIQEERQRLSETAFDLACDQLLDLIGLAADGATDSAPVAQRRTVEAQIRRHVRGHASEPGLSVADIARELGWSARYLQYVLKDAGTTVRDLVRAERLRLARTRLSAPSWDGRSIAQIAYACGFASHAAFATAYRREFGVTPRETRADRVAGTRAGGGAP